VGHAGSILQKRVGITLQTNTKKTDQMIPDHYLHITLGLMVGVPIGFAIAAFIASRKMRRISSREWMAARKFYLGGSGQ